MAFSDTMKIVQKDLSGPFYNGKPLRKSDVLTVDPRITRIVFRSPLDIKAISCSSSTELIFMHKVKILHIMCAGRMVALDNVFCGAIEAGHDIIVKGDLTTWLGDVETINGNICVSGNLCAEGRVIADSGYVIVNKDLEKIGEPKALGTWSGSEGQPLPQEMRDIASTSGRLVKALMSKLGML